MKKLLIILTFLFIPSVAWAQCNGIFQPGTICGNSGAIAAPPAEATYPPASGGVVRANIPTTKFLGMSQIVTSGYRTAGDMGAGAIYTSVGANCPTGWGAITDASGTCWNLVLTGTGFVSPGYFGAYGNFGTQTITSADVLANPQWRGTYTNGMGWDYVAMQEAIYAAVAQFSTPGTLFWNSNNPPNFQYANIPLVVPCGNYYITNQLFSTMTGGSVTFACGKQGAIFFYAGTHPGTMWLCDRCSYSVFRNVSLQDTATQNAGTALPLFSFDSTGTFGNALLTQQNTFYDLFIQTGPNGLGMEINRTAGSQGDTQTWINPIFVGSGVGQDTALIINSANALNETMIGGDIQGYPYQGVQVSNGQFSSYGTHMENQSGSQFSNAPLTTQFTTFGSDLNWTSQVIGSSASVISGFRSEGDVLLAGGSSGALINGGVDIIGSSITGGDVNAWGGLPTAVQLGTVVGGNAGGQNTKHRVFMAVNTSGTSWNPITGGSGSNVIQDSTASYTTNQWAGKDVFIRFSSNGAYSKCLIVSNTSSTITYSLSGCSNLSTQHFYQVSGQQTTEPNWDTVSNGFQAGFNAGAGGFGTQAGSTCVGTSFTNSLHLNDYVVIPQADVISSAAFYPNDKQFFFPLYAKVTSIGVLPCSPNPGGQLASITVDKAAGLTVVNGAGYFGTPITDPGSAFTKWINIPVTVAVANKIVDMTTWSTSGVGAVGSVDQLHVGSTGGPWQDASGNYNAAAPGGFVSYDISARAASKCADITASTSQTDVTTVVFGCNAVTVIPTSNTTLNAPLPPVFGSQEMLFLVKTSGTTAFTVTFGNNFNSNGVFNTGTVNAATYGVLFRSNGTVWQEVSRNVYGPTAQPTLYSSFGIAIPTCASTNKGAVATVSDATSPVTYNGTYTASGTITTPVFCNGSAWVTH